MHRLVAVVLLAIAPLWAAGELSNRRAPGFSLPDVKFNQHDLADYRAKVVLLEIMLTNCPHCITFAPVLEKVFKKYGGRVQVLSLVNPPDSDVTVTKFTGTHKLSYPILFDCGQVAGSYMKATPQRPSFDTPHLFLIDQNGQIRNDWGYGMFTRGIFEGDALFGEIDKVLNSQK